MSPLHNRSLILIVSYRIVLAIDRTSDGGAARRDDDASRALFGRGAPRRRLRLPLPQPPPLQSPLPLPPTLLEILSTRRSLERLDSSDFHRPDEFSVLLLSNEEINSLLSPLLFFFIQFNLYLVLSALHSLDPLRCVALRSALVSSRLVSHLAAARLGSFRCS